MKHLYVIFLLSLSCFFACNNKNNDPVPATNTTTITNNNSEKPVGFPDGIFQLMWTKSVDAPFSFDYEQISANFFSNTGSINGGSVRLDTNSLPYDLSTKNYFLFHTSTRVSLPVTWHIIGVNDFPSHSQEISTVPDSFALMPTVPDSIFASNGLTISLDKVIANADSVQIHLYKASGSGASVYRTKVSGQNTYSFTSLELASLSSGTYTKYILAVKANKQLDAIVSGKKYRFLTIRAAEKSIYIK